MLHYSYQYNLKIVGVPLVNENESAEDTANLCLKLFSALGNDISVYDIDIAHRVPQRNAAIDNGRRRQPNAIVCKFTRRMARDKVLASRRNTSQLTPEALGFSPTAEINRIRIYSHLTPRLQELLYASKARQGSPKHAQFQVVLVERDCNLSSQNRYINGDSSGVTWRFIQTKRARVPIRSNGPCQLSGI